MLIKLAVYCLVLDFPAVTGSLASNAGKIGVYFFVIDFPSVTSSQARDAGKTRGELSPD